MVFIEALPRNATGKVLKGELRARALTAGVEEAQAARHAIHC
ncbi:MAG: hypothetical protein R3F43_13200 [bacterium]